MSVRRSAPGRGCSRSPRSSGPALAVVSGAADWGTAHRLLAALALPPIAGLVVLAWISARRLLPAAVASLVLFGLAALLTSPGVHLAVASLAFGAIDAALRADLRGAAQQAGADLHDYVTLTKPRVMSLLLLTGGAATFVGASGVPAWGVFAVTMVGLALACGGAAALNHYLDRDIDQLMGERTATAPGRLGPHRAGARARVRHRALGHLVRAAGRAREPADRAARARREPLLRLRLHALAQALDAAEHRHRRRRRRRAAARRLRRDGRPPRLGRARHVRDRVPLDAAALLGARADDPRPLREREGADAAGREGRPRDGASRSCSTPP